MRTEVIMLALGKLDLADVLVRAGVDVLALLALVGWLYRRRHSDPDMPLVFTALNIGLFAGLCAISAGQFKVGIGFAVFGVLSLIRLRSTAFTLTDVAYSFLALVLALIDGLAKRDVLLIVALNLLVLAAVWLVDDPRLHHSTRVVRLILDRIYDTPEGLRADVVAKLGAEPDEISVSEVDYVRETTKVTVRYPAASVSAGVLEEEPSS